MANKTVEEILKTLQQYAIDCTLANIEAARAGEQWVIHDPNRAEASRQLYEAELKRIGFDPLTLDDRSLTKMSFEEHDHREKLRAELRTKARAFYGITETEEGAEEVVQSNCNEPSHGRTRRDLSE